MDKIQDACTSNRRYYPQGNRVQYRINLLISNDKT